MPTADFRLRAPRAAIAPALCAALIALSGCDLVKRNEDAVATLHERVIGMPSGVFFERYGRATSRSPNLDGTVDYVWESRVGYASAGPAGLDDRICRLRLKADRQGRMQAVEIEYDAPGLTTTSRCREIFTAA